MSQHVFISHSTKDDVVVDAIHQTLDHHRVEGWVDSRHLQPGDDLDPVIEKEIREAACFVVVLSEHAKKSDWVLKEIELARQVRAARPEYRLVPVLIDGIKANVVKPWLGADVVAIELESLEQHDLSDAMTQLLDVLGIDLLRDDDGDDESAPPELSDLILELTQPAMRLAEGKRRPIARARLVWHPAVGEPLAGEPFDFTAPLGPIETEHLRWYLESFFRWTSDVLRKRAEEIEAQLPQWGNLLFQAAFSEPAAAAMLGPWRRSPRGDKSLRRFTVFVDPAGSEDSAHEAATQLLSLPWELIHDPAFADKSGYLFRGARGVRVRRRLPDANVIEPEPAEPPVRVLLVSPRPEDDVAGYIDHRVSARPVVDSLAKLGELAELTLLDPPTLAALDAELRRAFDADKPYHVVHFDGHGVYDKQHGLGSLCFEHDRGPISAKSAADVGPHSSDRRRTHIVSADELAAILRDHNIPLFVLEACQSAQAETDPTSSVAGRLLACGVSSVIAMSHSVLVETARRFTTVFYQQLIRGRRIGQAMLAAQDALFQQTFRLDTFNGPLHMQDWFVPVLFQERPDPQLLCKLPTSKMKAAAARARKLDFGQLPDRPAHSFVGRSRELLQAERRLCGTRLRPDLGDADPPRDAPYVVLIGEGGEGKTTLAVELARWLIETQRFERAAFVSVEHEASVHSVLQQLGEQLVTGWLDQTQGNDERGLKLLRQTLTERSCVLVIDNLESLLSRMGTPARPSSSADNEPLDGQEDSSYSDVLAPLFDLLAQLNPIDETRIIFTSRSPLPPPFAEHHIRIGRLSRSEAVELVSHVLKQDRVQPRADHHEESDIDKLVDAVNCHARSLVLLSQELQRAGVATTTANLTELMHRLHTRYPNDRERSLFASLELSLRRLSPEVRKLVPKLAVFHGGFHLPTFAQFLGTASSAASLEGIDQESIMQKLAALGEPKSEAEMLQLLTQIPELAALFGGVQQASEQAQAITQQLIHVGLAQPMSYNHMRLEPALGPYLRGELTEPDLQAAEAAWLDAMTQLAGYLRQQQFKDVQQAAILTLLELPNLLAALECRAFGEPVGVSHRTDSPQADHSENRPGANAHRLANATIEALESTIDMATSIEGLIQNLGRPQALSRTAAIRSRAAVELAKRHGDDGWSHAGFEAMRTDIERLLERGRFREAVNLARALIARSERAGESAYSSAAYDLAGIHFMLGRALRMSGAASDALAPLSEARRRFERLAAAGNAEAARMASVSLTDYADCLCNLGQLDEAASCYEVTIKEAVKRNDSRSIGTNKGQLGTVRLLQRRYPEALAAWDEARRTFEQLGEPGSVATAWHQIGLVHQEARQYDRAEHAYQQSLHIEVSRGGRTGEAASLGQLGNLYSVQGRREEAVRFYRQAADAHVALGDLRFEGQDHSNVANQLILLGRHDEARREVLRAIECNAPFGHAAQPWKTFDILSDLERAVGDLTASAAARSQAIAAYLAYRRDGGEPMARVAAMIGAVGRDGWDQKDEKDLREQMQQLLRRPDLPEMARAAFTVLQAILTGSRDAALANDPRLNYADAVELFLLLERLADA